MDPPEPVALAGLPSVVAIAAGDVHTAVLADDGTLHSWGLATRGPPFAPKTTGLPERLDVGERIASVACGGGSTVVTTESGATLCWPNKSSAATAVPLPAGLAAGRIAASGEKALVFVETCVTTCSPRCSCSSRPRSASVSRPVDHARAQHADADTVTVTVTDTDTDTGTHPSSHHISLPHPPPIPRARQMARRCLHQSRSLSPGPCLVSTPCITCT